MPTRILYTVNDNKGKLIQPATTKTKAEEFIAKLGKLVKRSEDKDHEVIVVEKNAVRKMVFLVKQKVA